MKTYLVAASALGVAASAFATVSSTMVADTYIVQDGSGASAKFYSVLDIYVQGNHVGDVVSSVTGLNGTSGHAVVFATSSAQGTGLTRDANGKITAGTITSDIFVQAGNSSWQPTYTGAGASWDSFVTVGGRKQNASVTNRAASLKTIDASNMQFGTDFTQANVANSNYINNSGGGGWYNALGASAYLSGTTALATEMPFARLSLYNSTWNSTYTDLDRTGLTTSKGQFQTGRAAVAGSATFTGNAGTSLDFCYMVGRFAIDVTGKSATEVITMNAQFNMVGKNGTGTEAGSTFTGATTAAYKSSSFFNFAVPGPGAGALLCIAGLTGRRRKA